MACEVDYLQEHLVVPPSTGYTRVPYEPSGVDWSRVSSSLGGGGVVSCGPRLKSGQLQVSAKQSSAWGALIFYLLVQTLLARKKPSTCTSTSRYPIL